MLVAIVPICVLIQWSATKDRKEQKAGYTTMQNWRKDLEQRDPYMGRVIRKAGAEYLERSEFLAIVQAAKLEAKESARMNARSRG
ncbi:hypothetical protein KIH31_15655 [Paenarthrobacter sp. DKR-5]|uniref:hypothetical protein n=1 Tax=Paenarthrobacter sp. DKR-5 TaxID=2835535 RepID=UPI001BDD2B83|nr:hypothetical protein [Paenarthrobacter sp. DKR-5]MBT1004022.1 hypothetical protein [Paenarthrobacter sp. DKR-5]